MLSTRSVDDLAILFSNLRTAADFCRSSFFSGSIRRPFLDPSVFLPQTCFSARVLSLNILPQRGQGRWSLAVESVIARLYFSRSLIQPFHRPVDQLVRTSAFEPCLPSRTAENSNDLAVHRFENA